MKYMYALLPILLLSSCNHQENTTNEEAQAAIVKINPKQSNWHTERLKGRVKFLKWAIYSVMMDKPGEPEKDSRTYFKNEEYNEQGVVIESAESESHDSVTHYKYSYTYDAKGNKLQKLTFPFGDNKPFYTTSYKYDTAGNIGEEKTVDYQDRLKETFIYHYDNKGNRTEYDKYNSSGLLVMRDIYKYDNKGIIVEYDGYYDGQLRYKDLYIFDEHGNEIKITAMETGTKYYSTYTYEYDKTGNWIRRVLYGNDKKAEGIEERAIEYYN